MKIEDQTIMALESIVSKSIPEGVIAGGDLCRGVGKVTEEDRMKVQTREDRSRKVSRSRK